jgi:uncharacterized YccA/Bax inhibitor family protein
MKTWYTSPSGAITLSLVALLTLLVRSYLDTRYILVEDFGSLGTGFVALWILVYAAIIGGWMWALLAATADRQGAWITLLGFALMTGLGFGAASLLAFANFAVEFVLFGASLVAGLFASAAVGLQLRRVSSHRREKEKQAST